MREIRGLRTSKFNNIRQTTKENLLPCLHQLSTFIYSQSIIQKAHIRWNKPKTCKRNPLVGHQTPIYFINDSETTFSSSFSSLFYLLSLPLNWNPLLIRLIAFFLYPNLFVNVMVHDNGFTCLVGRELATVPYWLWQKKASLPLFFSQAYTQYLSLSPPLNISLSLLYILHNSLMRMWWIAVFSILFFACHETKETKSKPFIWSIEKPRSVSWFLFPFPPLIHRDKTYYSHSTFVRKKNGIDIG